MDCCTEARRGRTLPFNKCHCYYPEERIRQNIVCQNGRSKSSLICQNPVRSVIAIYGAGVAPPLSKWSGQEVGVAGCGLSVVL